MIHREEVASVLAVLDVLEYEAVKLGARSRLAGMWEDWARFLKGDPVPWQHPWELPSSAIRAVVSSRAAIDG